MASFWGAPYTLVLGLAAFVLTHVMAIPLGILAAWKRNTAWDHVLNTFAVIGHQFADPHFRERTQVA